MSIIELWIPTSQASHYPDCTIQYSVKKQKIENYCRNLVVAYFRVAYTVRIVDVLRTFHANLTVLNRRATQLFCFVLNVFVNPLTPNDPYRGRPAPLTSKVAFYIFIQPIQVLNILNMVYTLLFSSPKCSLFQNSNVFGSCIIPILYTGCAKINNSGAKSLRYCSHSSCAGSGGMVSAVRYCNSSEFGTALECQFIETHSIHILLNPTVKMNQNTVTSPTMKTLAT